MLTPLCFYSLERILLAGSVLGRQKTICAGGWAQSMLSFSELYSEKVNHLSLYLISQRRKKEKKKKVHICWEYVFVYALVASLDKNFAYLEQTSFHALILASVWKEGKRYLPVSNDAWLLLPLSIVYLVFSPTIFVNFWIGPYIEIIDKNVNIEHWAILCSNKKLTFCFYVGENPQSRASSSHTPPPPPTPH